LGDRLIIVGGKKGGVSLGKKKKGGMVNFAVKKRGSNFFWVQKGGWRGPPLFEKRRGGRVPSKKVCAINRGSPSPSMEGGKEKKRRP